MGQVQKKVDRSKVGGWQEIKALLKQTAASRLGREQFVNAPNPVSQ
jgi:hypothetical protein